LVRGGIYHIRDGWRVRLVAVRAQSIDKIRNIIREEMNLLGGRKFSFLRSKIRNCGRDRRWSDEKIDVWFRTELKNGTELASAVRTKTDGRHSKRVVSSYRDSRRALPISNKFRNELRAKIRHHARARVHDER